MKVMAFLDILGQDDLPPLTRLEKHALRDRVFSQAAGPGRALTLFIGLVSDPCPWVCPVAFQSLGPFISTFANPARACLIREDGTLSIQPPATCTSGETDRAPGPASPGRLSAIVHRGPRDGEGAGSVIPQASPSGVVCALNTGGYGAATGRPGAQRVLFSGTGRRLATPCPVAMYGRAARLLTSGKTTGFAERILVNPKKEPETEQSRGPNPFEENKSKLQVVAILHKLYSSSENTLGLRVLSELVHRFRHCAKWVGRQAFVVICQSHRSLPQGDAASPLIVLTTEPGAIAALPSRRLVLDPHAVNVPLDSAPAVFFMRVRLGETGEIFRAPNCRIDMTVRELKEGLELVAGIPFNLQRLQYLDQGVLMDDTTLRFHDVVPGGVISLCIWHYGGWTELVLAAMEGDPSKVFSRVSKRVSYLANSRKSGSEGAMLCSWSKPARQRPAAAWSGRLQNDAAFYPVQLSCLGIADNSLQTVNSQQLEGKKQKLWTSPRAFVALFITSHRGLFDAVRYLLENGANCLGRSPLGRTPLHVAAAMGRLDCIGLLLEHGASIHDKDAKGETPIALARRLNRKQSEQRMLLLHWVMKTGATDLSGSALTKAFQRVKSGFASKYRTQTRLPVAALASGR
ncbi:Ankyrin repeat domain-containing protein 60 [Tupaia chinensis]|uniref:Ankyrin repeat domain-containing protein 60 n=1 Tax=Tupaia chinensis TaxID=246437 RepID=L9LBQ7_TUPCH|nr:Ankyrin repeat domain-containing protein 60 [Tupaia chinensis]